jgi:hypothetical protein
MAGNRDWVKPVASQSFNDDSYVELGPSGVAERHPPLGTEFDAPWDYFIVENRSAVVIRVCWDTNASVAVGQNLVAGQIVIFQRRAESFISIFGGDGTPIPIRMFRW